MNYLDLHGNDSDVKDHIQISTIILIFKYQQDRKKQNP